MRAGDCSLRWEPELVSPGFTFYSIGQGRVGCLVLVLFLGVLFSVCFVLSVPDLSFWFCCPTMTILAQLNDCHSCNDARSIVQKKLTFFLTYLLTVFLMTYLLTCLSIILSDISFDIISDISSNISFWHCFWHIFWHSFWHIFWHSFWHIFWHSFCYIFWHICRHSLGHIFCWHIF